MVPAGVRAEGSIVRLQQHVLGYVQWVKKVFVHCVFFLFGC
jgi:hypothetical protein